MSVVTDLNELVALHASGQLSDEEFESAKRRALGGRRRRPKVRGWHLLGLAGFLVMVAGGGSAYVLAGSPAPAASPVVPQSASNEGEGGADLDAASTDSATTTTEAPVDFDIALARMRAVVPELGNVSDETLSRATGQTCLGLASGLNVDQLRSAATDSGIGLREFYGVLALSITAVCPDQTDNVSAQMGGVRLPGVGQ